MKFVWVWTINLLLFVSISVAAVATVAPTVCEGFEPILLSQAGTTDPWRGFLIATGLWMVFCASKLEDSQMMLAFLGFLLAFVVSMFETNAHAILIVFSGMFLFAEVALKLWNSQNRMSNPWTYVALSAFIAGLIFLCWAIYCYTTEWPECSPWYISEYVAFGLLFLCTFVLIDNDKEFHFKKTRGSRSDYEGIKADANIVQAETNDLRY